MSKTKSSQAKGDSSENASPRRTTAEWVSFAFSLLLIIVLIAAVIYFNRGQGSRPAMIEVQPQWNDLRQQGAQYYLPVLVENRGGQTVENVWVELTLQPASGEAEVNQVSFDILAGDSRKKAVVTFGQDPRQGELRTQFSFREP